MLNVKCKNKHDTLKKLLLVLLVLLLLFFFKPRYVKIMGIAKPVERD